jgi:hypothetical protein
MYLTIHIYFRAVMILMYLAIHLYFCAVMILMYLTMHSYFLVYKLASVHEDSQFSLQMELVVLRILNMCVLDFSAVSVV